MYQFYKINANLIKDITEEEDINCGINISNKNKLGLEQKFNIFLKDYNNSEELNGEKISANCFPITTADVFISHSHNDLDYAHALAGFLKTSFNLHSFIDTDVWDKADLLQKLIDDKFCVKKNKNGHNTYDYSKRNFSTSHIHMILAVSLLQMIYQSKCVILIESENSLYTTKNQFPNNKILDKTYSPWLYAEIMFSKYIEKVPPQTLNKSLNSCLSESFNYSNLKIAYPIDDSIPKIHIKELKKWLTVKNKDDPLIELWNIMHEKKILITNRVHRYED